MKIPQKYYHLSWMKNKMQGMKWNRICEKQSNVVEKYFETKSFVIERKYKEWKDRKTKEEFYIN